jgi:hypothetical protein
MKLKKELYKILKQYKGKPISDDIIHDLADKYKVDVHKLESLIYSLASKYVSDKNTAIDGKGDNYKIKDVDPFQMAIGIRVEREHSNNLKIQQEISQDHLVEVSNYYDILIDSGLVDEKPALITHKKLKKIERRLKKYNQILKNDTNNIDKIEKYIKKDIYDLTYLIPYNFSKFINHPKFKTNEYKYLFNYIKKSLILYL